MLLGRAMTKKNPMLGMWLATTNAWVGTARGHLLAEMRRHQAAPPGMKVRPTATKGKRRKKGK
jgi:hypothetical protein